MGSRAFLQEADAQSARVQGNAELMGGDRRRVKVDSHKASVARAHAAQEDTKIVGGGAWARRRAGAGSCAVL